MNDVEQPCTSHLTDVYYLHLVQYRTGWAPVLPEWCAAVVEAMNACVPLSRAAIQSFGPAPTESADPAWGIKKDGRRFCSARPAVVATGIERLRQVPADATSCFMVGERRGSQDRLSDIAWSVDAFRPELRPEEPPDIGWAESSIFSRQIRDSGLVFTINTSTIDNIDDAREGISACMGRGSAYLDTYYGFVTVAHTNAASTGWLYSPKVLDPNDPQLRNEEIAWWRDDSERGRRARGVYWGNFFGREMAEAMRSAGVAASLDELSDIESSLGPVTTYPLANGSLFVELTPNPLDAHPTHAAYPSFVRRTELARDLLNRHGLLVLQSAE